MVLNKYLQVFSVYISVVICCCFSLFKLHAQETEVSAEINKKHSIRIAGNYYAGKYDAYFYTNYIPDINDEGVEDSGVGTNPIGIIGEYKLRYNDITEFFARAQYSYGNKRYYKKESSAKIENQQLSFLVGADFHYLRWEKFSLYAGAGVGINAFFWKTQVVLKSESADDLPPPSKEGSLNRVSAKLKVLCAQFNYKDLSLFSEFGYGADVFLYRGLLDATFGIGYNF